MGSKIQAVSGMKDMLPEDVVQWQSIEGILKSILTNYAYSEIRSPMLEETKVFKRAIGQVTDIVEKEMYTFEDQGGDFIALRPEGTAQCVRAVLEHGLIHNKVQKLWYMGPMFRREKPQKGRLRQFHQLGVETFGIATPDADLELLYMNHKMWRALGVQDGIKLQINSLGTPEERLAYRNILVDYFSDNQDQLDEDSLRRLKTNPLRILDSKNKDMQSLIADAPSILDYLGEDSTAHFETIKHGLDLQNIAYTVNPRLVRGLDYYTHTVYEWVSDYLGAQSAVCAGGRYDGLVEKMGGRATPATGFALGLERLLIIMEEMALPQPTQKADVYIVHQYPEVLATAEKLREALPNLQIQCHLGSGGFKSQFKRADQSGASWAIVIGEDELQAGTFTIKPLREEAEQQTLKFRALVELLNQHSGSKGE